MFSYHAYGLVIHSALPLPELEPSRAARADVVIRIQDIARRPVQADQTGGAFEITPQEAYMCWEHVGAFLVRNGNEITVDPLPSTEERLVRLPLLGVVLAMLLHQREQFVLHASAVAVRGQAVIFLGRKRQGKSTMAATLYARGHMMVADDIVAVGVDAARAAVVFPGFPQFKLWPEAVASSLGDDPQALPVLATGTEKRARTVVERFALHPLPLRAIYLLETGAVIRANALSPQAALVQLMTHTYIARFGRQLLQGNHAAHHLQQCARLIRHVPIYALERPHALERLPDVAQFIEATLCGERAGAAVAGVLD